MEPYASMCLCQPELKTRFKSDGVGADTEAWPRIKFSIGIRWNYTNC